MAFGINFPNFQPPVPFDRARRAEALPEVPQNPARGSLVMIDYFQDSYNGEVAHGNVGAHAAEQQGFRGKIYAETAGPDRAQTSPSFQMDQWISQRPRDAQGTREAINDMTRMQQTELLTDVTGDLDKIRQRGLRDSAVNISLGTSPVRVAEDLYRRVRTAPRQSPPGSNSSYQFAQNVFNAYGIDQNKFFSNDGKVSGPERQRLQQALLDSAQRGRDSQEVQGAQAAYGRSVRALEANNNSVVVSAGNQEEFLGRLARDAGNRSVNAATSANRNILGNSDVTMVGATRWNQNGAERIAEYSNRDPQVDIYASGSVGNGANVNRMQSLGTSFASPRVAAAMAALHGNHPGMPSGAVENLMRNRLTHDLGNNKVLDFGTAEEYMRRGVF